MRSVDLLFGMYDEPLTLSSVCECMRSKLSGFWLPFSAIILVFSLKALRCYAF